MSELEAYKKKLTEKLESLQRNDFETIRVLEKMPTGAWPKDNIPKLYGRVQVFEEVLSLINSNLEE